VTLIIVSYGSHLLSQFRLEQLYKIKVSEDKFLRVILRPKMRNNVTKVWKKISHNEETYDFFKFSK